MRHDIEFDCGGHDAAGVVVRPRRCVGPRADDRDVPRLQRGQARCSSTRSPRCSATPASARSLYDNRNLGATDGEPRQEIDPWAQVRDYRDAITYARTRDEVDRERDRDLGLELQRRARDRGRGRDRPAREVRRRAGAADQRPRTNARRLVRADLLAPTHGDVRRRPRGPRSRGEAAGDHRRSSRPRASRARCRPPTPTTGSRRCGDARAPAWLNECTLRSVEMFWEYEPGTYLP